MSVRICLIGWLYYCNAECGSRENISFFIEVLRIIDRTSWYYGNAFLMLDSAVWHFYVGLTVILKQLILVNDTKVRFLKLHSFTIQYCVVQIATPLYSISVWCVLTSIFYFLFYFIRDPNSVQTLSAFHKGVEWAKSGRFSQQDVDEAKLSVFSAVDSPVAPSDKG